MCLKYGIIICLAFCLNPGTITLVRGQDSVSINKELSAAVMNGVFLENLGVTIPWEMHVEDIERYGNPHIVKHSKHSLWLYWDTATILRGTYIKQLRFSSDVHKCFSCSQKQEKLITLQGPISIKDGKRIQGYLEGYSGVPGTLSSTARFWIYYWMVDQGMVLIYFHKRRDECHLELRKRLR